MCRKILQNRQKKVNIIFVPRRIKKSCFHHGCFSTALLSSTTRALSKPSPESEGVFSKFSYYFVRVFPRRQCKTVSNLHLKAVCDFLLHKYLQARKVLTLCVSFHAAVVIFFREEIMLAHTGLRCGLSRRHAPFPSVHAQRKKRVITFKKLLCYGCKPYLPAHTSKHFQLIQLFTCHSIPFLTLVLFCFCFCEGGQA